MKRFAQFTSALAAAVVITATSIPARGQESPRDSVTYDETVPNLGLVSIGGLVLGVTYSTSAIVASTSDEPADRALFVPVAGPWIDLAVRDSCDGTSDCDGETSNKVLLVADGLGQAAGALQIVSGFLFPSKRTVTRVGSVRIVPQVGLSSTGLTAFGTF